MRSSVTVGSVLVVVAVTLVSAQQASSPTQAPTPRFKAQVEYIEVDALVLDQQGNFIRDLAQGDFRIFEDGKPQQISNFAIVDLPIERADQPVLPPRPIEPDVQSNERTIDGRVYVMILDDLHTTFQRMPRVQAAARQFIERNLGANDLMAVISTGGRAQDAQEFTTNKHLLLAAVDALAGSKLESDVVSQNSGTGAGSLPRPDTTRIPNNDQIERVQRAQMMLAALRQTAEWFGGVHGRRKTMLLFSEGIDFDFADARDGAAASIFQEFQDTIAASRRANVSVYAIDPRGLMVVSEDAIELASIDGKSGWLNAPPTAPGNTDRNARAPSRALSQLSDELRVSQRNLRTLAEDTGGFAAINRNDFTGVFNRIVRDNSAYYVLAYYPRTTKPDNRFHRIEVKVNRPGVTVVARRGYLLPKVTAANPKESKGTNVAAAPGMPAELRAALNSPLSVSGLTMRVAAAPFRGSAPNASVVVVIELAGRDLTLDANNRIEISFLALDSNARVHGARNNAVALNLRPEMRTRVAQSGVRLLNRMELVPGRYQLRVGARDPATANVGAVIYNLEVPDFSKPPIALSGVVMTSLAGDAMMTARADDQLKDVLPAPPMALRTFAQYDEIALFAEVYDNSGTAPHKVDIKASVLADDGQVLFETDETRDSSELQGATGGFEYAARIPLSDIAPGSHVLNVEARSRLASAPAATRQVRFTVAGSTAR